MKKDPVSSHRFSVEKLIALILIAYLFIMVVTPSAKADEVFFSHFTQGKPESLGWVAKGDWSINVIGKDKPNLQNNPGAVVEFGSGNGSEGTLTKKFDKISNPDTMILKFDAGYGWGDAGHVQVVGVELLDADGNGYVFTQNRAKATWGAQWDVVTKYAHGAQLHWAPEEIDTTQKAVMDGGGLRTFTITRDSSGNWTFDGTGWVGGPLKFTDKTYSTFSQVILLGTPNNDDLLYNKIKLITK